MLHILVAPVLIPGVMMLCKSIHDTPQHDDPAVQILLALTPPLKPFCAELKHNDEDTCVANL